MNKPLVHEYPVNNKPVNLEGGVLKELRDQGLYFGFNSHKANVNPGIDTSNGLSSLILQLLGLDYGSKTESDEYYLRTGFN